MKWLRRILIAYGLSCLVMGILLAEVSLHMPRRSLKNAPEHRARIEKEFQTKVNDVSIAAADGVELKAWYVQPQHANGMSVILLHGIGDNRIGSSGLGDPFLAEGYAVLMPDSREHGGSGGPIATYGILEREDVHRWAEWLRQRDPGCTYLLGESMGAAIGLQATAVTPQLCAVAVESPYARFREISYERLGRETRTGTWFWKTLGRPIIEVAILYSRLVYGVYLPNAEPKAAVEASHVPSLLIAGTADKDIPMHHAQELEAVCVSHCELWIVPGADHGGASTVDAAGFHSRVLGWFAQHRG